MLNFSTEVGGLRRWWAAGGATENRLESSRGTPHVTHETQFVGLGCILPDFAI